jgi:hypothetical protein
LVICKDNSGIDGPLASFGSQQNDVRGTCGLRCVLRSQLVDVVGYLRVGENSLGDHHGRRSLLRQA